MIDFHAYTPLWPFNPFSRQRRIKESGLFIKFSSKYRQSLNSFVLKNTAQSEDWLVLLVCQYSLGRRNLDDEWCYILADFFDGNRRRKSASFK